MPDSSRDWRGEAERRLADSRLSAAEREEIARELAGYLEDLCSDAPARGLDENAGMQSATAELHEDKHLGAHLYRARKENPMNLNDRTKRFWLPGMTTLLASVALFYLAQYVNIGHAFWISHNHKWMLGINIFWLCCLPALGAAAAYWSRRQGAGRAVQTAAGLSPFVLFLAVFFGRPQAVLLNDWQVLPIRFVWRHVFGPFGVSGFFSALIWTFVMWVCIPIGALLVGILPVLRQSNTPPRAVNHA